MLVEFAFICFIENIESWECYFVMLQIDMVRKLVIDFESNILHIVSKFMSIHKRLLTSPKLHFQSKPTPAQFFQRTLTSFSCLASKRHKHQQYSTMAFQIVNAYHLCLLYWCRICCALSLKPCGDPTISLKVQIKYHEHVAQNTHNFGLPKNVIPKCIMHLCISENCCEDC